MKEEVIIKNLGLIYKAMKDLNCVSDTEEAKEEYYFAGLLGLMEASKKYDASKGKSGYLYSAIRRNIISVFEKNTRPKRRKPRDISANILIGEVELQNLIPSRYNLEKEVIDKIYVEWLLNKLKNKRYKTFLIEYYGINCSALNGVEIAKKYGVSNVFVSQEIKKALEILREIIKENK